MNLAVAASRVRHGVCEWRCASDQSMETLPRRLLLLIETTSWGFGLLGLLWWAAFHIGVVTGAQHDLQRFAALRVMAPYAATPDQSLWSPARVTAWRRARSESAPAPLAVLRIPKI